MIPKAAEIIQSFVTGKPFGYGAAIGGVFGLPVMMGRFGTVSGIEYGYQRATETGRVLGAPDTWQRRTADALKPVLQKWLGGGR